MKDVNATVSSNRGNIGNPYHKPAGAPNQEGGRFTNAEGSAGGGLSDKKINHQIKNPYQDEYEGEFYLINRLEKMGKISPQEFLERFDALKNKYYEASVPIVMEQTGMRESECYEFVHAIKDYCGTEYEFLDEAGKIKDKDIINNGLARMPKFEGSIFRGLSFDGTDADDKRKFIDLMNNFIRNYKSGGAIRLNNEKNLSSFSSKQSVAVDKFAKIGLDNFHSVVVTVKDNRSGVAIGHISPFDGTEDEVLVSSSPYFKVTSIKKGVKRSGAYYYFVELEEIDE